MPKVQLFIPCLVDQLYPEMGVALVKLLRHLEVDVEYDPAITCCGQPAFNAGQLVEARSVARTAVNRLSASSDQEPGPVVCPSGSCTAMMRVFYSELFHGQPEEAKAVAVGARALELSEFLSRFGLLERLKGKLKRKVAFHNSCHSARELGLRNEYHALFENIEGLEVLDPSPEPICCGFGGLFCQKFQGISTGMAKTRLEMCEQVGAEMIISNDPGCIMHLRLQAVELGIATPINHTAQLLVEAMGIH